MKRLGVVGIVALAFFGLTDSIYLLQHEVGGTPLLCDVQHLSGCNTVLASQYSHLFGVPVAGLGVIFYSILFVLAALELALFDRFLRRVLQGLAIIGLIMSLYSTFIQIFFIQALCVYCLASATISVIIFILASFIEPIKRPALPQPSQLPMPPVS